MLDVFGKRKAIKNVLLLYIIKTLLLNKRCHVSFKKKNFKKIKANKLKENNNLQ